MTPSTTHTCCDTILAGRCRAGRLEAGFSITQAAAEVDTIGRALVQNYPLENHGLRLRLASASLIPGRWPVRIYK